MMLSGGLLFVITSCGTSPGPPPPAPARFTDVKQLFYEAQREAAERRGARDGAAGGVAMPDIAVLATNYRTHRWEQAAFA